MSETTSNVFAAPGLSLRKSSRFKPKRESSVFTPHHKSLKKQKRPRKPKSIALKPKIQKAQKPNLRMDSVATSGTMRTRSGFAYPKKYTSKNLLPSPVVQQDNPAPDVIDAPEIDNQPDFDYDGPNTMEDNHHLEDLREEEADTEDIGISPQIKAILDAICAQVQQSPVKVEQEEVVEDRIDTSQNYLLRAMSVTSSGTYSAAEALASLSQDEQELDPEDMAPDETAPEDPETPSSVFQIPVLPVIKTQSFRSYSVRAPAAQAPPTKIMAPIQSAEVIIDRVIKQEPEDGGFKVPELPAFKKKNNGSLHISNHKKLLELMKTMLLSLELPNPTEMCEKIDKTIDKLDRFEVFGAEKILIEDIRNALDVAVTTLARKSTTENPNDPFTSLNTVLAFFALLIGSMSISVFNGLETKTRGMLRDPALLNKKILLKVVQHQLETVIDNVTFQNL